jgi:hypothetical protein
MQILDSIRTYIAPIEQRIVAGDVFLKKLNQPIDDVQRSFVRHVLRPMLPTRYSLITGKAFSVDDVFTREDSILICDGAYAIPLGHVVPCESVYAMCDVIPHMNAIHFERGVLNIGSLKVQNRPKATAHDVSPVQHLGVFGARYAQLSDDKLNPYLGYIVAQEAESPDVLFAKLTTMIDEGALRPEHTPDAIVSLHDGWMISRQTRTGEMAVPRSSFAKFGIWHLGENLLPALFVLLNLSLSQILLRGPDLLRPLAALTKQK